MISFVPSHANPPQGLLNVDEPIAVVYVPAPIFVNAKSPSLLVEVRLHGLPVLPELDVDARKAELALLDLARDAASGLEVPPDDADDLARLRRWLDRLFRPCRHVLRRDRGETEPRNPSGVERRLQHEPLGGRAAEGRCRCGRARKHARL